MAIKISGTDVIDDSRQLTNITNLKTVAGQSILGAGDITASGNYAMRSYTTPGTWTKPSGLKAIKVTVVGGGGASGNTIPSTPAQVVWPGAGAGGTSVGYIDASTIPGPVVITVGQNGITTNPAALSGNTSSFGAFCSATGGTTGRSSGAGGIGIGGTYNITGQPGRLSKVFSFIEATPNPIPAPIPAGGPQPGTDYLTHRIAIAGDGGSSLLGDGGSGDATNNTNNPLSVYGYDATGYGAGASGQISRGALSNAANGTPGIVIVEEFY
jgi:hypothetical protein